ncbi:Fic family protein [Candidatus Sulfurimonas baltica]|uniref:Fic family protein n=1 Tax=Candidatus Sulfurimonas baltica TaxID=2740404 RepID=A0A7S7LWJ3_9BACT|nr:Fic family protein [Candidatus Sulfurimonas baltica]QOY52778.1 Fic family protein [Candidatus Sulfurimonas baltica]
MSYKPPFTITSKMLNLVSDITEALAKIESTQNNIITPYLRKTNRIKTLAGTLEIEGNLLGEEKITAILDGKRVLGTMRELAEVDGAIKAYEKFEEYQYDSLDDLLQAHKILMTDILTTAGTFRRVNVGVGSESGVSHVAPRHERVPELMIDLFEWLQNSDDHPLIKSSVFHYEFEFIHPFSDGNGRIGRLWQSVILYHYKSIFSSIATESIVRDYQDKYYKALDSGELGESTPFIEFMLGVILEAIENVPNNVPNNVPKERELSIISLITENSKVTVKELAIRFSVNDKTIKRDLEKLKQENKIKRVGSTRSGYWEVLV